MTTLERSNRNWSTSSTLPNNLWKHFEETNITNVIELVRSMEISISYGWMGVASEISEHLQLTAGKFLDQDSSLRIQVETERLKRFSYMGFHGATKLASQRVLDCLEIIRDKIPLEERLVTESVAITAVAWFLQEHSELEPILKRCQAIDAQFEDIHSRRKYLCASFMHAIAGRLNALKGDSQGCRSSFQKAAELCKANGFSLPLAHITMHYADCLRLLGNWQGATKLAKDFLNECCRNEKNPFRSHLLLRAILLLLEAPKTFVSEAEFRFNAYRYRMLVYAMGLEESENLYPLLARAETILANAGLIEKPDLYQLFMPGPIIERVNTFDGPSFEKLILLYYQSRNFKVVDVGDSLPAVDLLALAQGKSNEVIAIQAKNRSEVTQPRLIPTENDFDDAKRAIARNSEADVSLFHWHSASKLQHRAEELLFRRVKGCFGDNCTLRVILNAELVEELLLSRHLELLFRIFSDEFKLKTPAPGVIRQ